MRPLLVLLLSLAACAEMTPEEKGQACAIQYTECKAQRRTCFIEVRKQECPNEFDTGFDDCLQEALSDCGQAFDLCVVDLCLPEDECAVRPCPR